MHKMATPSARRRLGALLHAAADPDSGVTHIATTAIETVLRSDDEDTITTEISTPSEHVVVERAMVKGTRHANIT